MSTRQVEVVVSLYEPTYFDRLEQGIEYITDALPYVTGGHAPSNTCVVFGVYAPDLPMALSTVYRLKRLARQRWPMAYADSQVVARLSDVLWPGLDDTAEDEHPAGDLR
ncbi:MAG: hypothetical protein ACRDMV_01280 [Streptosporangiales bacterium]